MADCSRNPKVKRVVLEDLRPYLRPLVFCVKEDKFDEFHRAFAKLYEVLLENYSNMLFRDFEEALFDVEES